MAAHLSKSCQDKTQTGLCIIAIVKFPFITVSVVSETLESSWYVGKLGLSHLYFLFYRVSFEDF